MHVDEVAVKVECDVAEGLAIDEEIEVVHREI